MIRRVAMVAVVASVAAVLTGTTWPAPASADPTTPSAPPPPDHSVAVPLGHVSDMVVDPADGLVFYANDSFANDDRAVAVSHLDGSGMQSIPGTVTALALTLGPDGKIYAAEKLGKIAVIDPKTLAVTVHSTGASSCPTSIAFAGGQLWFGYHCVADGSEGVATLDLATDTVTPHQIRVTSLSSRPQLRSVPNHPDLLVASELTGVGQLSLIDVSGNTPTITAQTGSLLDSSQDVGPLRFTVSPDGTSIFAASVGLRGVATFNTADLVRGAITYQGSAANLVAVSADGASLAVGAVSPLYGAAMNTYHVGDPAPLHTYPTLYGASNWLSPEALAWTGRTLLAVYPDPANHSAPAVRVLNSALQVPTTLILSAPSAAGRATTVTLTGQLVGLPSASVLIAKRDLAGGHILATVTTDADGRFSYTDLARVGGPNTYLARYVGDESHGPIDRSLVVAVSRGTVPLTVRIDRSTYNYHDTAHVSIHLSSHDVKKVQVWVREQFDLQRYLATLTVDANGNARLDHQVSFNTTFIVKFYGDYYYNPRVVAVLGRTRALVTADVSGVNGMDGIFHVVCCTALVSGAVLPRTDGPHVDFETQRYLLGRWVSAPGPGFLNYFGDGRAQGQFLRSRLGYYRIRAVYHTSSITLGNVSGWVYLKTLPWP